MTRMFSLHMITRYTSPVIDLDAEYEIAILGEMNKWVPVSKQRTINIRRVGLGQVEIDLVGSEGETVEYTIAERKKGEPAFDLAKKVLTFGPSGEALLVYSIGSDGFASHS